MLQMRKPRLKRVTQLENGRGEISIKSVRLQTPCSLLIRILYCPKEITVNDTAACRMALDL